MKTQEIAIKTESKGERLMDEESSPKTNDIVYISPISKYVVRQQRSRLTCPRPKAKNRYEKHRPRPIAVMPYAEAPAKNTHEKFRHDDL